MQLNLPTIGLDAYTSHSQRARVATESWAAKNLYCPNCTCNTLSFPDKRAAMLGAFIARFALGFVICNIKLPWPGWLVGLLLGILLSLPDAIITKAFAPILASGAIGGLIIGWIAAKYGR